MNNLLSEIIFGKLNRFIKSNRIKRYSKVYTDFPITILTWLLKNCAYIKFLTGIRNLEFPISFSVHILYGYSWYL